MLSNSLYQVLRGLAAYAVCIGLLSNLAQATFRSYRSDIYLEYAIAVPIGAFVLEWVLRRLRGRGPGDSADGPPSPPG